MQWGRSLLGWGLTWLLLFASPAAATEYVPLGEHPELRILYKATNTLYLEILSCRQEEDCICKRRDAATHALERVFKILVSHPEATDVFILDERGALRSERGRGVLVKSADLKAIEHHVGACDHPPPSRPGDGEAPTTLREIYAAETAYFMQHNRYLPIQGIGYNLGCTVPKSLGFKLTACTEGTLRYAYTLKLGPGAQSFSAEARSATGADHPVVPGCATADLWRIDEHQRLVNPVDATVSCSTKRKP